MVTSAAGRVVSVLLILVLLAACGQSPAGDTPDTDTPASPAPAAAPEVETSPAAEASPEGEESPVASPTDVASPDDTEASPSPEASPDDAEASPSPEGEAAAEGGTLTVYSGRNEELVGPIIERFEEQTGIQVDVRYGDTAELAATILNEAQSPADVFFAQDAGTLGALAEEDRLAELPDEILAQVEERFRSDDDEWVGISGRARVVVYNTDNVAEADLPDTIFGFTDPEWQGRLGWAPTNGSFQAFVTALRVLEGDARAREWLEGIQANQPQVYENNTAIVQAVGAGEIDAGFVNHYYLFRFLEEQGEDFPAQNYYLTGGDPGALINVAGVGILESSQNEELAEQFVTFLLSEEAQQYFADETYEYPLAAGVETNPALPALDEIQTPDIDLSDLDDLEETLQLLQELGIV